MPAVHAYVHAAMTGIGHGNWPAPDHELAYLTYMAIDRDIDPEVPVARAGRRRPAGSLQLCVTYRYLGQLKVAARALGLTQR